MQIDVQGQRVVLLNTQRGFDCASAAQAKYLAMLIREELEEAVRNAQLLERRWKFGWLVRKGSTWIGVHYSEYNKRWCINLIPCVTFWVTQPGGKTP